MILREGGCGVEGVHGVHLKGVVSRIKGVHTLKVLSQRVLKLKTVLYFVNLKYYHRSPVVSWPSRNCFQLVRQAGRLLATA